MLRAARERRGLTLQALSEATKISPSVLTALENNEVEDLPGGLFIRSFVRAYAAEVGLDPEGAVDALLSAFPHERPDTVAKPRDDLAGFGRWGKGPGRTGMAIGLVIVSVIVVALLLFFGRADSSDSGASGTSGTSNDEGVTAAVEDVAANQVEPSRVGTSPPSAPPPPLTGVPVAVSPDPTATESAGSGPLTVALHPTGPTWVSLSIDGERVFAGVLEAGEREVYEAAGQIVLNVGDAGLFDFSLNEQPGRSLGDPGQVVTVEIDGDNYLSFVRR